MPTKAELLNQAAAQGEEPSIPNDGHFFGKITDYLPTDGGLDRFNKPVINIYLKISRIASEFDIERKAIKSWSAEWKQVTYPSLKALSYENQDIENLWCHGELVPMSKYQGDQAFYTAEDRDGNTVRRERQGIHFHTFYTSEEACQDAYTEHYGVAPTDEVNDTPAPAPAPKAAAKPAAPKTPPAPAPAHRNVPQPVTPEESAAPAAAPANGGGMITRMLATLWNRAGNDPDAFEKLILSNAVLKAKGITMDSPEVAAFLVEDLPF